MSLTVLREHGYELTGLRSKSWDELSGPEAPTFDFVFTVCDNAAAESCPVWPGKPTTAHWGIEDPAAYPSAAQLELFRRVYMELHQRIHLLTQLDIDSLDRPSLEARLREIGESRLPAR